MRGDCNNMKGTLYGIGTGPGDPDLLTLKAIKTISGCDVIAVPDSGTENQIALNIVKEYIAGKPILSLDLPMTCDKFDLQKKRELAAEAICAELDTGKSVVFLRSAIRWFTLLTVICIVLLFPAATQRKSYRA